jgi:hypothetical protein
MSANKLENYILFNAFKWPASLLALCALLLFVLQPISHNSQQDAAILKQKQSLNNEIITKYSWMCNPKASVASIIQNNKLDIQPVSNSGNGYTGKLEDLQKLENLGVVFTDISSSNHTCTVQIAPLPRINL